MKMDATSIMATPIGLRAFSCMSGQNLRRVGDPARRDVIDKRDLAAEDNGRLSALPLRAPLRRSRRKSNQREKARTMNIGQYQVSDLLIRLPESGHAVGGGHGKYFR
jgi:hypothetical protein